MKCLLLMAFQNKILSLTEERYEVAVHNQTRFETMLHIKTQDSLRNYNSLSNSFHVSKHWFK